MPVTKMPDASQFFLIGLIAPQSVKLAVQKLQTAFEAQGSITAPLPAMLPVAHTISPPPPPVPGLLPPCAEGLVIETTPAMPPGGGWIILPVDAGEWPENLGAAFPSAEKNTLPGEIFPDCTGIPIAWQPVGGVSELVSDPTPKVQMQPSNGPPSGIPSGSIGWRALNLVCYEINFSPIRPWFKALHWRQIWKRRLRRAPVDSTK